MKTITAMRAFAHISFLLCIVTSAAHAAVAIIDDGMTPAISDTSNDTTLGYSFTIGPNNLLVTSLGLWDDDTAGFVDSHDVGLWDTGTLIATVTVPAGAGATLFNEFRYVDLVLPVTLTGNRSYLILATGFSDSPDTFRNSVGRWKL